MSRIYAIDTHLYFILSKSVINQFSFNCIYTMLNQIVQPPPFAADEKSYVRPKEIIRLIYTVRHIFECWSSKMRLSNLVISLSKLLVEH